MNVERYELLRLGLEDADEEVASALRQDERKGRMHNDRLDRAIADRSAARDALRVFEAESGIATYSD